MLGKPTGNITQLTPASCARMENTREKQNAWLRQNLRKKWPRL
jgi:hypothetical protein